MVLVEEGHIRITFGLSLSAVAAGRRKLLDALQFGGGHTNFVQGPACDDVAGCRAVTLAVVAGKL